MRLYCVPRPWHTKLSTSTRCHLLKSYLDFMRRIDRHNDVTHLATAWRPIPRISDVQTQLQSA